MLWVIRQHFPFGVAELIWEFLQTPPEPWDAFASWQDVPEYVDGNYGQPADVPHRSARFYLVIHHNTKFVIIVVPAFLSSLPHSGLGGASSLSS